MSIYRALPQLIVEAVSRYRRTHFVNYCEYPKLAVLAGDTVYDDLLRQVLLGAGLVPRWYANGDRLEVFGQPVVRASIDINSWRVVQFVDVEDHLP